MGHKKKTPQPSPLTLLAIFAARAEQGRSFTQISRQTGYSVSSLVRWYKRWGYENEPVKQARQGNVRQLEQQTLDALFAAPPVPTA